ncbi:transmembrane amino acid transporter protein-domain-containing protein [Xylariaceae sp. FL0016]|nr:transmembrane amino acid transporter protein-domain-containing protein [Xylariaceae sp. FL0016]
MQKKHDTRGEATQPQAVEEGDDNCVVTGKDFNDATLESHEVFKKTSDGVDFRTVSWQRATIIFLKITFSLGVLSIPTALSSLGAVGGALSLVGWQALNTYCTIIQGDFRNRHPECHSLSDMGQTIGGVWVKELIGAVFLIAFILITGSGYIGLSVAFNALSDHSACTVWWTFLAMVITTGFASIRTLKNIGWLTLVGFLSLFVAILVIVIGVTLRDRPAAAPQTGDFDLGYVNIAHPSFAAGMTATATIFISSAGSSAFIPVISEMRRPRDYRKAVYVCMGLVLACYLAFTLVVYRWCGNWVANPALGSAGNALKKVSYGIALIGLMASGSINQHVAAKYLFVRILRNSHHLQSNTVIHWAIWMSCSIGVGAIAFILAESVAIFSYIISLAGSICFAPMALVVPGFLYLHDSTSYANGTWKERLLYVLHIGIIILGVFLTIGGTYATILSIKEAYASGEIGSAFSCADNSGTVG